MGIPIEHPDGRRYKARDMAAYERIHKPQGFRIAGAPEVATADPREAQAAFGEMTNKQLRAELAKAGKHAPAKANKAALIRLLTETE